MSIVDRRTVLAAGAAFALPGRARAAGPPPGGAVGLVCTAKGPAGMVWQGEAGALLDPAWRWHIGSNTKALTAALYARLAERERCRWEATLPELFPGGTLHEAWHDVRVEELLSHTAGLGDEIVDGAWLAARRADPAPPRAQRRALVERVLAAPPSGERGRYRYGNLNYVVVSAAIEQALDMAWEDAMRAELFISLDMRGAGFGAPPREDVWGRAVVAGVLLPVDPAGIADNPAVLWPSGGVHLTPGNYAQFLAILLRDGAPLFGPATLDRLLAPATPGGRYAGGWSLAGPPDARQAILTHNGSNTFWFASARVERGGGKAYAAMINRGGTAGAAVTAGLIRALGGGPT